MKVSNGPSGPPAPGSHWALVYDSPPGAAEDGGRAGWWRAGRAPDPRGRLTRGSSDRDLLRTIRARWLVVLLVVLLGLGGAAAFKAFRPAQYTVDMKLYVAAQAGTGVSPEAAYQGSLLSQQRVLAYVDLVDSPQVARAVVAQLGLPDDPDDVASAISASSATDSVIIDVSVVESDPRKAAAIAGALAVVFPRLVGDLERSAVPGADPPVTVRAVQPIEVPTSPSTPGLAITLALGLLAGLAVGVAIAVLLEALDRSVKTPEVLSETTGVPNLGVLRQDPAIRNGPLVLDDVGRPAGESFRQIRTNLQFVDLDRPRRLLVITSSLPGEGKTTTVSNLAAAFAAVQVRVLVIDADLRRPRLAEALGLEKSVGLTDVLANRVSLASATQRSVIGQFDVLASGTLPPNPSEVLASRQMATLLAQVRARYDIVLIDAPPVLPVTDAAVLATRTDGAILLARYKQVTTEQLRVAVEMLDVISAPLLGTILTMIPPSAAPASKAYRPYGATGIRDLSDPAAQSPVAPAPGPVPPAPPDGPPPNGPSSGARRTPNGAEPRRPAPPVPVPPARTAPSPAAPSGPIETEVGTVGRDERPAANGVANGSRRVGAPHSSGNGTGPANGTGRANGTGPANGTGSANGNGGKASGDEDPEKTASLGAAGNRAPAVDHDGPEATRPTTPAQPERTTSSATEDGVADQR